MLIGEVARRSGVSARMLRHYESLGLLEPSARTSGGYREYTADDIHRIFHIEGLRALGMSLRDVGSALADPDFDPEEVITELIAAARSRIAAERELLARLERVARLHHTDGESLLQTIDLMRSLESRDVILRHRAALDSGAEGAVPVDTLSRAVLDESVLNAAGALRWALAQSGADAVSHLVDGLSEGATETRRNAIRALDEVRRNSPGELDTATMATITQALRRGLTDTDGDVRTVAALALGQMLDGTAIADLFEMAMDGPKDIDAAEALAGFVTNGHGTTAGDANRIMSELRRHSRSPQATVRFRVLQVLAEIPGPESDDFIAELIADPDREVAVTAKAMLHARTSRATSPRAAARNPAH